MKMVKNSKIIFFYLLFFLSIVSVQAQEYVFHIEKIELEGNAKSKDSVIFENLSFSEGDSLSESEINNSITELHQMEIFSNVTMQPRPGSSPGSLIIKIIIEERYWPHIRFKGGFNELEGWFLTPISLNFDNILGLGNFTNLELTLGDRLNAVNFNYVNPSIFDSELDFILRGSGRELNFVHYINNKKWILSVDQGGLFLAMRSRDKFMKHFIFGIDAYTTKADSFGWRYNSDDRLYDFPENISRFMGDEFKSANFKMIFNFDYRDYTRYPVNGWWFGGEIEFADKELGSLYNFSRYILDARKYHDVYKKIVVASRIKYGYISHDAPFYEKFYLGGPNSLRGFNDRTLSPVGGGNQVLQFGTELRFPISAKNYPKHLFSGVVFFDSGSNAQSKKLFDFNRIKSSYGVGLRVNIPFLGIIRADYGIPTDSNDKKIQLSLGHSF